MLRDLAIGGVRREERLAHIHWRFGACLLFLCIACGIPRFAPELSGFASTVLLTVLLATGLNFELRLAGLPDFNYASWFAIGAYSGGMMARYSGLPFWAWLPFAMILAAVIAVFIASPLLRRRIEQFGMLTLGLAAGVQGVMAYWIPAPVLVFAAIPAGLAYWSLVLATVAAALVSWRIRRSLLGRMLRAVQQDEIACHSIGVDIRSCRVAALAIGAGVAGAAGCLFAAARGSIEPADFDLSAMAVPFAIAVLGGRQGQLGILIAAIAFAAVLQLFPTASDYRLLITGAILVSCAIWRALPERHIPQAEHRAESLMAAELAAE